MCAGSRTQSFIARYELWDLVSRNVIDWFHSRDEAAKAVQAYVDADDDSDLVLVELEDETRPERSLTGNELRTWAEDVVADRRRTA